MKKFSLALKLGAIGFVILLLLVPLLTIGGLVSERQARRDATVIDIARSAGLAQQIVGPLLVVPYVRIEGRWSEDAATSKREFREYERSGVVHLLPEAFEADTSMRTELRSRGIYEARLFHSVSRLRGHYAPRPRFGLPEAPNTRYRFGRPILALGIADIRGIGAGLSLTIQGQSATFEPGSSVTLLGSGVHALLPGDAPLEAPARIDFELQLPLQGTGELGIVPVGNDSRVHMSSDWPHPGFTGDFLPVERKISAQGFEARWQTSLFATNLAELLQDCADASECKVLQAPKLGVSIVDPVDQYLKTERAIKYALLFIVLTFAGVFLCEILGRMAVHTMHYGLVGLALALFFLLLLSTSEHLGFALAYVLSAAACVGLLSAYLGSILRSRRHGAAFGGAFAGLYAMLYALLSAEDYALLMGSLLLFILLALFMMATRRVDWSRLGAQGEAPAAPALSA